MHISSDYEVEVMDFIQNKKLLKDEADEREFPADSYNLCVNNVNTVDEPPLYVITPTYPRAEQLAELTRLAQTLINVNNLYWIVSEDSPTSTKSVVSYLNILPINIIYLRVEMPKEFKRLKKKPRGVANRMAALKWIHQNAKEDGVLYFADDDNTYDLRLFKDIRTTRRVSMFPVGLVGKLGLSSPIVKNGKVVGFFDGWKGNRKFPIDMAGFALNIQYLKKFPKASMKFKVGYEEDSFLKDLNVRIEDIEPKAENCTQVWVWHTQARKKLFPMRPINLNKLTNTQEGTNIEKLYLSMI